MICNYCSNNIIKPFLCKHCQIFFCSLSCLQIHNSISHTNNNILSQNKTIINSPFLVKGTLNNSIQYDSIYSLKNFVPIIEQSGKIKIIGKGSYGQVYLGYNIVTKKNYAIKHMDKKNIYSLLHSLTVVQKEIEIHSKINHPNIVKLLYVKETEKSYDLIMEYAPGGNLFQFIRRNKGLNEKKSFNLFIQVLNAVYFLHEHDLIHRDIKPENILIFENNIVKLCDFGWCVKLNGKQRETFCGTTEYMSPELVNSEGYGKENDVWSLGVLLYEMIHGHSPFIPNKSFFTEREVMQNIINYNLRFEKNISDECKQLICRLLEPKINNRYKVEDIYSSEFVKKYENITFGSKSKIQNDLNLNQYKNHYQINNNLNLQQIEMNNNYNINIMNMNNYEYNIHIPENIKNYYYNENNNNNIRRRNKSFSKHKKDLFNNYINYPNKYENSNNFINDNNYIINNINEKIIKTSNKVDESVNINNTIYNDNNSKVKHKELIAYKTCDSFYPNNIGKKREKEILDIYSAHNNDPFLEDTKRDNKDFYNFNNSIINLYFQNNINNIIPNNNLKEYNNNLMNDNIQLERISNQYAIQFGPKEQNNKNIINKIIENSNDNIISNIDINNNINNRYYYNDNNFNLKNNSIYNNNNFNLDFQEQIIESCIKDNNTISISTIPTTSILINSENNENLNNNNIDYNNSCLGGPKDCKISKISEFKIEEDSYNNNDKSQNTNKNIEINIYNNSPKLNNIKKEKIKIINESEKEPIDNVRGKKKGIIKNEEIEVRNVDIPVYNDKYKELINNKGNETIINSDKNKIEKRISALSEDKIQNKKRIILHNNKCEQLNILLEKQQELYKTPQVNRSKSCCDKDQIKKIIKKKKKNIIKTSKDRSNDISAKIYYKKQKINKSNINKINDYSINNKNEKEINKNIIDNNHEKGPLDNKNKNTSYPLHISISPQKFENKINASINQKLNNNKCIPRIYIISNKESPSYSPVDKKPKNNNKNYLKKKSLIPTSPNIKRNYIQFNNKINNNNSPGFSPKNKNTTEITDINGKNIIKLGTINLGNNQPENNINKYLKKLNTSDKINSSKIELINFNNNKNDNLQKKTSDQKLNTSFSLKNNQEKEKEKGKIKIYNIKFNIDKLVHIRNNKSKDSPSDNTSRDKKINKIKDGCDSKIINDNDKNDERNKTPKRKPIFSRIRPYQLMQAFQKELNENSKKKHN